MKLIFQLSILILSICFSNSLIAQIPNAPSALLTPNAAEINRYGNTPVSLFTGTPQISIPLYTVKSGKLSLPITLSYHSGGVKPDEHPGWVGMGWSLQTGGAITRKKNDEIDEFDRMDIFAGYKGGYYYEHNITQPANWDSSEFWERMITGNFYLIDTEPDEFSFCFGPYSGSFMLDSNGKWVVRCNNEISVELNGLTPMPSFGKNPPFVMSKAFSGFTLTTEDGIKYVFGEDAVEYSMDFINQEVAHWQAMAWYLKQIIHPNGDTIELNYERGDYIAQLSSSANRMMYEGLGNGKLLQFRFYEGSSSGGTQTTGQLLAPVYLNSIKAKDCTIRINSSISEELTYTYDTYFSAYKQARQQGRLLYHLMEEYTDSFEEQIARLKWKKLDCITITDTENKLVKAIDFTYINNPTQRLTLGSISMNDFLDIPIEKYTFRYNDLDKLPEYLSNEIDHWGFYNSHPLDESNIYNSKEPNPYTLLYGSLKEIIYPTGGKTIFEFEPHYYSKELPVNRWEECQNVKESVAGGIRIKRITDIPNNGQSPVSREFLYVSGYAPGKKDLPSSGVLNGKAIYMDTKDYQASNGEGTIFYATSSTASLTPVGSNSLGYHVGYSEVVERYSDGSYTIQHFTNIDSPEYLDEKYIMSLDNEIFTPCSSRANDRGKLLEENVYDAMGNIVKKKRIIYEKDNENTNYVRAIYCAPNLIDTRGAYFILSNGTVYKIFTYSLRKSQEIITEYTNKGSVARQKECTYLYNTLRQLQSKNILVYEQGKEINYRTDYRYAWQDNSDIYNLHVYSLVSSIKKYRNNLAEESISNKFTLINNQIPVLTDVYQAEGCGAEELRYSCLVFDRKGNPIYTIQDQTTQNICLWGNGGTDLIAEIQNAGYEEVRQALGIRPEYVSDYQALMEDKIDSLRIKLPQAEVITYTYRPLAGVSSIIDSKRCCTYFYYDSYCRLSAVKDNDGKTMETYSYHMEHANDGKSGNELEDIRRQALEEWVNSLRLYGVYTLQPGETRTFGVEANYIPLDYRWRIEGDIDMISYEIKGNKIEIHNKSTENESGNIEIYLDLIDGDRIMSTVPFFCKLRPSKFTIDSFLWNPPYDGQVTLKLVVRAKNDYKLNLITLIIDRKEAIHKAPEAGYDSVAYWVTLKRKGNEAFYTLEASDYTGESISLQIPVDELFPIDESLQ